MGVVEAIYKFKYFIFCQQKNIGKMARAQGKDREFGINWSVATLYIMILTGTWEKGNDLPFHDIFRIQSV